MLLNLVSVNRLVIEVNENVTNTNLLINFIPNTTGNMWQHLVLTSHQQGLTAIVAIVVIASLCRLSSALQDQLSSAGRFQNFKHTFAVQFQNCIRKFF
jgi:hypothetical protein